MNGMRVMLVAWLPGCLVAFKFLVADRSDQWHCPPGVHVIWRPVSDRGLELSGEICAIRTYFFTFNKYH